jgi:hypothetical protein
MRVVSSNQLTLELQPGLLQRYTTLRQCVYHTAWALGLEDFCSDRRTGG